MKSGISVYFIFSLIYLESQAHFSKSLETKRVQQSWGKPWPKPQHVLDYANHFMLIRPHIFHFHITNHTCDLVELALKRYYAIILQQQQFFMQEEYKESSGANYLDILHVNLLSPCEHLPHEDMDESYKLNLDTPSNPKGGLLLAKTNWGLLRGLETFSQLIHTSPNNSALRVKSCKIHDYPRFPFRSILLDTARHFIPKKVILQNLDIMAMNKMNVFHWHIVDDQSFAYQSYIFPQLSEKGAYHPYTHVYSQLDVKEIIEYARLRGIRVIAEFDSPGHTQSWASGSPDLLTPCYSSTQKPSGSFGPIDPTVNENYEFLRDFFSEVASVFPDKFIHLGGDEVDFSCWQSNPEIQNFMEKRNWTDFAQLEGLYMKNLLEIVASFPQKKSTIVWQEVVDNGVTVHSDTLVNVWKGSHYQEELENVTSMGYKTILYACWYMDIISWGIDWPRYYQCEPQNFTGRVDLVKGGGAALWTEFVDATNLIPRLWPRASATAERLWSSQNTNSVDAAEPRMEEHRCRLLNRGFKVQPANGPGSCYVDWDKIID